MTAPERNVSLHKTKREHEGSCNACGRHPFHCDDAPEDVFVITLGGERCTTSVRLCPDCLGYLKQRINAFKL